MDVSIRKAGDTFGEGQLLEAQNRSKVKSCGTGLGHISGDETNAFDPAERPEG